MATIHGPVQLHAVHLASARPGEATERDQTMTDLGARLIVAGDLDTADHRLAALQPLRDTQTDAGGGFDSPSRPSSR